MKNRVVAFNNFFIILSGFLVEKRETINKANIIVVNDISRRIAPRMLAKRITNIANRIIFNKFTLLFIILIAKPWLLESHYCVTYLLRILFPMGILKFSTKSINIAKLIEISAKLNIGKSKGTISIKSIT